MNIVFNESLTSNNLYQIIESYWEDSFRAKSVNFDLGKLEWISNSEVAFLIGWIRALRINSISVSLELQSAHDISTFDKKFQRRKYCLEQLLLDWKIVELLPDVKLIDRGIKTHGKNWNTFSEVLPITIFEYNQHTFDEEFDSLYNNECSNLFSSYQALIMKANLNYFDTYYLNYSVFKELLSNVFIHSNETKSGECIYSIGLNKKYHNSKYEKYISDNRKEELSLLESDFYTDNDKYRNIDYIEITFQDFGVGIVKTLLDKYNNESSDSLFQYFGDEEFKLHNEQNLDSRILHYSLLLFTSQFEIDRKFEIHDFIPRGLYILQEIIEKYNGYLEILSGAGGISVSFKNGIKEITFINKDNEKVLFPGTRIKLVFPSSETIISRKNKYLLKEEYIDLIQ
jgi:hypothetical protein